VNKYLKYLYLLLIQSTRINSRLNQRFLHHYLAKQPDQIALLTKVKIQHSYLSRIMDLELFQIILFRIMMRKENCLLLMKIIFIRISQTKSRWNKE